MRTLWFRVSLWSMAFVGCKRMSGRLQGASGERADITGLDSARALRCSTRKSLRCVPGLQAVQHATCSESVHEVYGLAERTRSYRQAHGARFVCLPPHEQCMNAGWCVRCNVDNTSSFSMSQQVENAWAYRFDSFFYAEASLMVPAACFDLSSARKRTAFWGVGPCVRQSGHSQTVSYCMSRHGSPYARRALYTLALQSIRVIGDSP